MPNGRISARSFGRSLIRSDRFIPHPQTCKDVRRHVQRVRHPWRDRSITLRSGEPALGQRRIVVAMDQVMNDTRVIWVLFPKLFEDGGCLELFRQARVVRCRVAYSQDRETVERLGFEIVRILVAELTHRVFVSHDAVARSDWAMTRLSNSTSVRTIRRIVISVECRDESSLSIGSSVHRPCFFNGRLARTHLVRSRWCPNRMPPRHGDSPLRHGAFGIALGHRCENASRLFVEK